VDPFGDGDGPADEPGEFDPESLGPEAPSVDVDEGDAVEIDGDADKVVLRTFWGAVLSLNVALAAVPLGAMVIYFRGDWELGGLAVLVGLVAFVATGRFYYVFKQDRTEGEAA